MQQRRLATCGPDVLRLITQRLDGLDIGALWLTGDANLMLMLGNGGVRCLTIKLVSNFFWPSKSFLQTFKHLEYFSMVAPFGPLQHMHVIGVDISSLPPTLKSIDLNFANISEAFPSEGLNDDHCFNTLFPQLQSFSWGDWRTLNLARWEPTSWSGVLSSLPLESMTSLHLHKLPSDLLHLLPRCLRELKLYISSLSAVTLASRAMFSRIDPNDPSAAHYMTSAERYRLPPCLEILHIKLTPEELDHIMLGLPETLTELNIECWPEVQILPPSSSTPDPLWGNLPKGLRRLFFEIGTWPHPQQLPRDLMILSGSASIAEPFHFTGLPPSLTHLLASINNVTFDFREEKDLAMLRSLPPSLTYMETSFVPFLQKQHIILLPPSLTHLALPAVDLCDEMVLPFKVTTLILNDVDMRFLHLLPTTMTILIASTVKGESALEPGSLDHLQGWSSLVSFDVNCFDYLLPALPPSITDLEIGEYSLEIDDENDEDNTSDSGSSAAEITPSRISTAWILPPNCHWKNLTIYRTSNSISLNQWQALSQVASLTSIHLYSTCFPASWLQWLPPQIESLELDGIIFMKDEHLKLLPEGLLSFRFSDPLGNTEPALITPKGLQHLPRSLQRLAIPAITEPESQDFNPDELLPPRLCIFTVPQYEGSWIERAVDKRRLGLLQRQTLKSATLNKSET
jgi:hypothetical protein